LKADSVLESLSSLKHFKGIIPAMSHQEDLFRERRDRLPARDGASILKVRVNLDQYPHPDGSEYHRGEQQDCWIVLPSPEIIRLLFYMVLLKDD